jgi:integrase
MPDQARQEAANYLAAAGLGRDLAGERLAAQNASKAEAARLSITVGDAAVAFLEALASDKSVGDRHRVETAGYVNRSLVPFLGQTPLATLTGDQLQHLVDDRADKPATARNLAAALSRFAQWVRRWPVAKRECLDLSGLPLRFDRPKPPESRERNLTLLEVAAVWRASRNLGARGGLVRWLILTGARRNEAARATWAEIDRERGFWELAGSRTKNGRAHRVPLNGLAIELLNDMEEHRAPSRDLIFPGTGGVPVGGWTKLLDTLQRTSRVTNWTPHDLRRTLVSRLADAGVGIDIADKLLNHQASGTTGGVLAVYQRSERWTERVAAMATWERLLRTAIANADSGNVNL